MLLAAGANAHANKDLALRWAAANGHVKVAQVLLAAGANVHADKDGPLLAASAENRHDVISILLAAGADVHATKNAVLRQATVRNCVDVASVLLAAGADPTVAWSHPSAASRARMALSIGNFANVFSQEQRVALAAKSPRLAKRCVPGRSNRQRGWPPH